MIQSKMGNWGEVFAAEKMKELGCRVLARNFQTRYGEIDIIAQQGECICFVEVRTRSEDYMVSPVESITPAKREKIIASAQIYLQKNPTELQPRFDVFSIVAKKNKQPDYEFIPDAFELTSNS